MMKGHSARVCVRVEKFELTDELVELAIDEYETQYKKDYWSDLSIKFKGFTHQSTRSPDGTVKKFAHFRITEI